MKALEEFISDYLDYKKDVIMTNRELKQMQEFIRCTTGYKLEIEILQTLAEHHKNTLVRMED